MTPLISPIRKGLCVVLHSCYESMNVLGAIFKNNYVSVGHDLLKPFSELLEYGLAHGVEYLTLDQVTTLKSIDVLVCLDRPRADDVTVQAVMRLPIKKLLILYETEVIKPENWEREYHSQFDYVLTWNDAWVDGQRYLKNNFAFEPLMAYPLQSIKSLYFQRKLCVMVAGAKLNAHPNQLYSARIAAIQWFEGNAPEDFDLYGVGWPSESFRSWRGTTQDKLGTLSQYRFAICYENAQGYPGYLTEKIFDCFRAGVVPVYWGAPNVTDWVPAECFVDRRDFESDHALYVHLKNMEMASYDAHLDAISAFLQSPKVKPFSIQNFVSQLTGICKDEVNVQQPKLIVSIGYGDELPVYGRARWLWEFYRTFFPKCEVLFFKDDPTLPSGQMQFDGRDILVGSQGAVAGGQGGYAINGVWSAQENRRAIARQLALYRHLLATRTEPFFLFQTTITSVTDLSALQGLLEYLPQRQCFAGNVGRLNGPPDFDGLVFASGANSLFSSDVLQTMLDRFDTNAAAAKLPNDVWQGWVLRDIPRIALPMFVFADACNFSSVAGKMERLLAQGHFHFRIRTDEADRTVLREEIEPWIMTRVMECVTKTGGTRKEAVRALQRAFHRFIANNDAAYVDVYMPEIYHGPRDFFLSDSEM